MFLSLPEATYFFLFFLVFYLIFWVFFLWLVKAEATYFFSFSAVLLSLVLLDFPGYLFSFLLFIFFGFT